MIWGKTYKQNRHDIESQWTEGKNWYAWHPVQIEDGRWIWRESSGSWGETFHYYYTNEKEWLHLQAEQKRKNEEILKAKNDND